MEKDEVEIESSNPNVIWIELKFLIGHRHISFLKPIKLQRNSFAYISINVHWSNGRSLFNYLYLVYMLYMLSSYVHITRVCDISLNLSNIIKYYFIYRVSNVSRLLRDV